MERKEEARNEEKRNLLKRVDALLTEAYALPRCKHSWSRHEQIEAELMNLFRRVSDLYSGPLPYWLRRQHTFVPDPVSARPSSALHRPSAASVERRPLP